MAGNGAKEKTGESLSKGKGSVSESGVSEDSGILGCCAVSTGGPSPTARNLVRLLSNPERLGHVC